jgi:hypothetical protein
MRNTAQQLGLRLDQMWSGMSFVRPEHCDYRFDEQLPTTALCGGSEW